jgi:hypothetical protein
MVTIERRRGSHFLLPLLLIIAGLIFLLANLGLVGGGFWDRLFQLWPLVLVVIGLEVLTSQEPARSAARLGAFAVVLVLAAGATLYAIGPWGPASVPASGTSSAPLRGLTAGRLDLSFGPGNVTLTSADLGQDLYRASYSSTGSAPSRTFAVEGDTLQVQVRHNSPVAWLGQSSDRLDLTLNQAIPWAVTINAAALNGTVDLRTASLTSLEVNSASGKYRVELGSPASAVSLAFNGTAQNLTVSAPAGTEFKVHSTGVASNVTLPGGQTLSGAFNDQNWQSAGYPGSAGSYSIEMSGVANKLALEVPQS